MNDLPSLYDLRHIFYLSKKNNVVSGQLFVSFYIASINKS